MFSFFWDARHSKWEVDRRVPLRKLLVRPLSACLRLAQLCLHLDRNRPHQALHKAVRLSRALKAVLAHKAKQAAAHSQPEAIQVKWAQAP